jgi:H(+)-translocating pyrophosphatase
MAYFFYSGMIRQAEGDAEMIRIAQAVREGAYAYLSRQYKIVALVFLLLVAALIVLAAGGLQAPLTPAGVAVAGLLSGLCGFFGMKTATSASARTAHAAKQSLDQGLRVAFRSGAVMGLCVTGFALLDVSVWFFLLAQLRILGDLSLQSITTLMLSFAMGASLQALFARVGGGIYTKAADVGADLVGKVEAGIPEDDARNPATIADNVGDNVGDVAGMGADLYESYYGSILAAMTLAAAAAFQLGLAPDAAIRLVAAPPALAGLGIIFAALGIFTVRTREGAQMKELLRSLHSGVFIASGLLLAGAAGLFWLMLSGIDELNWLGLVGAIAAGLVAGLVIAQATEFYTSYEHAPTRRISKQAATGPATVIISGVAEGMISTWAPLLTVVVAILLSFVFAGGAETFLLGVFGVGIAAVGMLSTLAITLATDAYGPIADNAGGNAEMTHQEPYVRERTDMLDALGNTTAATGKGFAIGSAALTALALLAAYVTTVQTSLVSQARPDAAEQAGAVDSPRYRGHGLFTVPGENGRPDAGLLLSPQRRLIENALEDDARFEPDPRIAGRYLVEMPADDPAAPPRREAFTVVAASQASLPQILSFYDVTLMNPRVLCGLFLGVMLVFVFCAMTMNAVGRAANSMMLECRRQFEKMKSAFRAQRMTDEQIADPMQWPYEVEFENRRYPDYANCVAISTAGAQREMIAPSVMAVLVPVVVGLVLGVAGVMGMLAGALVSGFAVAIFMANAGGAWDNAKKYIETGELGGKGSEAHKATVVGDTVGDPFKDTSGPSLNILIKLLSSVAVVAAGVTVQFGPMIGAWLGLS